MNYGDEFLFDVTNPDAATAHHFYRKTTDWSVQQEVRIVTFPRGAAAVQPFDPRLLRRIILGHLMSADARARIKALVAIRNPPIDVVDERVEVAGRTMDRLESGSNLRWIRR